jgi:hypothetical protein
MVNTARIVRVAAALAERFGPVVALSAAYSRASSARWRTWGGVSRTLRTNARLRKFWYAVGAALRRTSELHFDVLNERFRLQAVAEAKRRGFRYVDMTRLKRSERTGKYICTCGRGYASPSDGLCRPCRPFPRPAYTIATYGGKSMNELDQLK